MNQRQRDHLVGYLFVLPFLISLGTFFLYAAVRTLMFSFTDYNLFNTPALTTTSPCCATACSRWH